MMADAGLALDAVAFAQAAGLEPDPWQAELLHSTARRILVNVTRQGGKTRAAATLAVHTALYAPGSLTLLLSPTLRQSALLFRQCLDVYQALGRPVEAEAENKLSLELAGGSQIVSLPGKEGTIRGYSAVALLIIDEAARVPDELYSAVRPMLAVSGGRLVALSTPFGTRGWWSRRGAARSPGNGTRYLPASADVLVRPSSPRSAGRSAGGGMSRNTNAASLMRSRPPSARKTSRRRSRSTIDGISAST
jgi:hypothetical protein